MRETTETPKVWIGCLAAYNGGQLHGEWIDATDVDELNEGRERVLATSPVAGAEEAFIADYDGFGETASLLGEYANLEDVARVAAFLEEHDGAGEAWIGNESDVSTEYLERFEDAYRGEWRDLAEYAAELADDMGIFQGAPDLLRTYFDAEAFGRDLRLGGDVWEADAGMGRIHVFDGLV